MMSAEGGAQPKEYLTKYASDRVRTASTVWLGSTLGGAECHDHKFDPFTQQDFYQFASYFADIQERGLYSGANRDGKWGPSMEVPDEDLPQLLEPLQNQLAQTQSEFEDTPIDQALNQWLSELSEPSANWVTPEPASFEAINGTQLTLQEDRSVLASGPGHETNTYTATYLLPKGKLTGLRLEALPDPSLLLRAPDGLETGILWYRKSRPSSLMETPSHPSRAKQRESEFRASRRKSKPIQRLEGHRSHR